VGARMIGQNALEELEGIFIKQLFNFDFYLWSLFNDP
jgi:hypothetical protein